MSVIVSIDGITDIVVEPIQQPEIIIQSNVTDIILTPVGIQGNSVYATFENTALKGYSLFEKDFVYTNGVLTQIKIYDNDKLSLLLTKTFVYTNGQLTQIIFENIRDNLFLYRNFVYTSNVLTSIVEE